MAAISTIRGSQLLIKVGNGASPEVFSHPCLINTARGIQFQSNNNKIITPDCDNPDDPAWTEVVKDGLSATITGAGTLDTASVAAYDTWYVSPLSKNVQVWLGAVGHWPGAFLLTQWGITGDRGNKAQVSLTLESDGALGAYIPA
jgi:predicted secreted protein